jgi:tRNA-uridine 2-sulfurtransferase
VVSDRSGENPIASSSGGAPVGRVVVAMSGGVDSAVASALLQRQGWEVAGVTFKLFCYGESPGRSRACCGLEGIRDAQGAARRMGIPHAVLDLETLFRQTVLEDFASEYGRARTPNPCVQCNTHVKFAPLLQWARHNGYDAIATGHYARVLRTDLGGENAARIGRSADPEKDQSYVLWGIPAAVLSRTLLPLGELAKSEVRALARDLGLLLWDKKESQDICFVDGHYSESIRALLGAGHPLFRPGEIRDADGRVLGVHRGLVHYTVGQRHGLGLGGAREYRVIALVPDENVLVVGSPEELGTREIVVSDLNLHAPAEWLEQAPLEAKIRYRQPAAAARLRFLRDGDAPASSLRALVSFDQQQTAVAPGQSCVLYHRGILVAGGRIEAGSTAGTPH